MSDKLTKSQIEFLREQTRALSSSDFHAVLSYYGISVKNKSILCIFNDHHDTHYGSCMISRDEKNAYCFVCNKPIDGVTIVMEKERLSYPQAMEFLWCQILGNFIPIDDEKDRKAPIISFKEMQFIGLAGGQGGEVLLPYNMCDKNEDVPGKRYGFKETSGCIVADTTGYPSIYKLYEDNRKLALKILLGKADETVDYYKKLKRDLVTKGTKIYSLVDQQDVAAIDAQISKNLRRAYDIRQKIREAS